MIYIVFFILIFKSHEQNYNTKLIYKKLMIKTRFLKLSILLILIAVLQNCFTNEVMRIKTYNCYGKIITEGTIKEMVVE